MNFAKVYKKHIKKKGISGALPHNLTDELLDYLVVHIEQYIQDNNQFPSIIFVPVLAIQGYLIGNSDKKVIHVSFDSDEELEQAFHAYVAWVVIEKSNRVKNVVQDKESLPTLENIFVNKSATIIL